MKVKELIEMLSNYPGDSDIYVLEKLRTCGAGHFANIIGIHDTEELDTNKTVIHIETDYDKHIINMD